MAAYSKVNGTGSLSPVSGGIWKIQKKRKMDDRRGRNRRKGEKDKEDERQNGQIAEQNTKENVATEHDAGENIVYGSSKIKKRSTGKVDLTI